LSAASQAPATPGDAQSPRNQRLAAEARSSAAAAAECVGGGLALIFAATPGDASPEAATRLRAAAGFSTAQAARDAARRLLDRVQGVVASGSAAQLAGDPSLGERAAAGILLQPLACEERVHGVLVVGLPAPLASAASQELVEMAELLALRFDHARLAEARESASGPASEEASEEILKLSEALFAQDIELLRSNEKLSKVEKLKNDFIERMSRELRTPLNGIIESIISVLTGENEALSEEAKQTLRSALDDGTAFLRTLQNILDLWRIKQAELPVEIQDVNFREIVDEAIFSVQDAVAGKPVSIETQIDDAFPKLRTDLAKLNQILFLLLDNAVKFTQRGHVSISASLEEDRLHCQIQDTGVGICPDDQPNIFEEFFQVDEPASRRYRGAGLGLTLVRDLIVLLEGEISLQSEIGSGSTFAFSIPVQLLG
jgi:signal transduction histidine kinase